MDSTGWIDAARYVLGVLFAIALPPAVGYWFVVHPFIAFWRRMGPTWTYASLAVFYLGSVAGLFSVRDALLGRDLGTSLPLTLLGIPLIALGLAVASKRRRQLGFKTLLGLPEISPQQHGVGLLTEGIYGRVRHPRYLEFLLGGTGWTLLINYLGVYVLMALTWILIYGIVLMEERELRQRYGQAHADYCARVPRFIPRWRR